MVRWLNALPEGEAVMAPPPAPAVPATKAVLGVQLNGAKTCKDHLKVRGDE